MNSVLPTKSEAGMWRKKVEFELDRFIFVAPKPIPEEEWTKLCEQYGEHQTQVLLGDALLVDLRGKEPILGLGPGRLRAARSLKGLHKGVLKNAAVARGGKFRARWRRKRKTLAQMAAGDTTVGSRPFTGPNSRNVTSRLSTNAPALRMLLENPPRRCSIGSWCGKVLRRSRRRC